MSIKQNIFGWPHRAANPSKYISSPSPSPSSGPTRASSARSGSGFCHRNYQHGCRSRNRPPSPPNPFSSIGFIPTWNMTCISQVIFTVHILGSAFILLATAASMSALVFYLILFNVALDTLVTIRHIQPVAIVKELVGGFHGAAVPYTTTSISHEHITIDKSTD